MLSAAVVYHNYNKLLNLQEGTKLTADKNGYLIEGSSPQESILDQLFGAEVSSTQKIINQTCRQLFDRIIKNQPSPLTSDHPKLAEHRVAVKSIIDGVSKLGQRILSPELESDLKELVESPETLEARLAIRQGIDPKPLNQTISGTYIMHNRLKQPWGIFKPKRQEVGGDKNPSWLVWAIFNAEQWNIKSGTGYLRECAAYQLDKDHFSNVPLTVPTNFTHPILDTSILSFAKPYFEGSFQLFKKSCDPLVKKLKSYETFTSNPKTYLEKALAKIYLFTMPVLFYLGLPHLAKDEIHKMAILDLRILNCDRHLGNCLIESKTHTLYPIDHGLILPNKAEHLRFEWMKLIQSRLPLSKQSLSYIENLDPKKDAATLKSLGISTEAIDRMQLSTMLLKAATAKGLTLYQVADLMKKKTPSGTYFEDKICCPVLTEGAHPHVVIAKAIQEYLNQ